MPAVSRLRAPPGEECSSCRMMDDQPWYQDGLRFPPAAQCGACCTGAQGYVWVNKSEIAGRAAAVRVDVEEFEMSVRPQVGIRKSLIEHPAAIACSSTATAVPARSTKSGRGTVAPGPSGDRIWPRGPPGPDVRGLPGGNCGPLSRSARFARGSASSIFERRAISPPNRPCGERSTRRLTPVARVCWCVCSGTNGDGDCDRRRRLRLWRVPLWRRLRRCRRGWLRWR